MPGRLTPYRGASDIFRKGRIASRIDFAGLFRDILASSRAPWAVVSVIGFSYSSVTFACIFGLENLVKIEVWSVTSLSLFCAFSIKRHEPDPNRRARV